jgi:hypothetical protein
VTQGAVVPYMFPDYRDVTTVHLEEVFLVAGSTGRRRFGLRGDHLECLRVYVGDIFSLYVQKSIMAYNEYFSQMSSILKSCSAASVLHSSHTLSKLSLHPCLALVFLSVRVCVAFFWVCRSW